ncbi:hypothetical protein APHAL10511_001450 [Amanita phalloides]|nr:hypothetical protein APHAL10511_001450 [Amanita phalloides]
MRFKYPLPPGPRGLPIIGNLLDLPQEFEWFHWAKYHKLYGPISSVQALGKTVVVLNTLDVCKDLLMKRSVKYSDRPPLVLAGEMVGWDQQMILGPYGKRFKIMRKMIHAYAGTEEGAMALSSLQEVETRYFLSRLMQNPKQFMKDIRLMEASIFLQVSHGYVVNTEGRDPFIGIVEKAAHEFYIATKPGGFLVDTFPILKYLPKWMPGAGFQRVAEEFRKTNEEQLHRPNEFVLREMRAKTALPSFSTAMIESHTDPEDITLIKHASNALYAGGMDTLTATIVVFFLAMTLYPDVERKAQQEIDDIVGQHRLPCLADRDKLHYLNAVHKEVLRWQSIGPMGIPHYTCEDDIYKGYFIPKGSIVLSNIWNIAHDENNYKDPMVFNPDRFIAREGLTPELDPHDFVFGFGRRRCPGDSLADANTFIVMAMTLSVFNIQKAKDANGHEITPKIEYQTGTVCHIKPFDLNVTLRAPDAMYLVQSVHIEHPPKKPSTL